MAIRNLLVFFRYKWVSQSWEATLYKKLPTSSHISFTLCPLHDNHTYSPGGSIQLAFQWLHLWIRAHSVHFTSLYIFTLHRKVGNLFPSEDYMIHSGFLIFLQEVRFDPETDFDISFPIDKLQLINLPDILFHGILILS